MANSAPRNSTWEYVAGVEQDRDVELLTFLKYLGFLYLALFAPVVLLFAVNRLLIGINYGGDFWLDSHERGRTNGTIDGRKSEEKIVFGISAGSQLLNYILV